MEKIETNVLSLMKMIFNSIDVIVCNVVTILSGGYELTFSSLIVYP